MSLKNPFSSTGEPKYPPMETIGQKNAVFQIKNVILNALKDDKGTDPLRAMILADYGHGKSQIALKVTYDINSGKYIRADQVSDSKVLSITFNSQEIKKAIDDREDVLNGFVFAAVKKLSSNDPNFPSPYLEEFYNDICEKAIDYFDFDEDITAKDLVNFLEENKIKRLFVFWDELEDVFRLEDEEGIYNIFIKNWGSYSPEIRHITFFFLCTWEGHRRIAVSNPAALQRLTMIYLSPFNRSMAWNLFKSSCASENISETIISHGMLQGIYSACIEHIGARLAQGRALTRYLWKLFDILLVESDVRTANIFDIKKTLMTGLGYKYGLDEARLERINKEFTEKLAIRGFEGDSSKEKITLYTILFDQEPRTEEGLISILHENGLTEDDCIKAVDVLLSERFSSVADKRLMVDVRKVVDEDKLWNNISQIQTQERVEGTTLGRNLIFGVEINELLSSFIWIHGSEAAYFIPMADELSTLFGYPERDAKTVESLLIPATDINQRLFFPSINFIQAIYGVSLLEGFIRPDKKEEVMGIYNESPLSPRLEYLVNFLKRSEMEF